MHNTPIVSSYFAYISAVAFVMTVDFSLQFQYFVQYNSTLLTTETKSDPELLFIMIDLIDVIADLKFNTLRSYDSFSTTFLKESVI